MKLRERVAVLEETVKSLQAWVDAADEFIHNLAKRGKILEDL